MAGGGSGGGGQQTVTQTQQIPEWQKDFALQNESIAASLASRPYPVYGAQPGTSVPQQVGVTPATGSGTTPALPSPYTSLTAASSWKPQSASSPYAGLSAVNTPLSGGKVVPDDVNAAALLAAGFKGTPNDGSGQGQSFINSNPQAMSAYQNFISGWKGYTPTVAKALPDDVNAAALKYAGFNGTPNDATGAGQQFIQNDANAMAKYNEFVSGWKGYDPSGTQQQSAGGTSYTPINTDLLVAGLTDRQKNAMNLTDQAATGYQPFMNAASALTQGAVTAPQSDLNMAAMLMGQGSQSWGEASPGQVASYMNPYVMASLAPQLEQMKIQQAQNRNHIGAGAAQAGAFGDARHGVADSLNDFYSDVERQGVIGQGFNNAYQSAMQSFQQGQAQKLAAGQNFGQLGSERQALMLAPASAFSQMATQGQQLGLQGAEAMFASGTQEQQVNQQRLNTAYQNFLNQVNWPAEQLNMRIAALANSPYSVTNIKSLAPANATAQNVGAAAALAGGVGSLLNGNGGGISGVYPYSN